MHPRTRALALGAAGCPGSARDRRAGRLATGHGGVASDSGRHESNRRSATARAGLRVSWLQPGTRFGIFQLEIRGARRDGLPHLGKPSSASVDLKYRGLAWSLEAGDTYFSPAIGDYRFANLAAPSLTFVGGAVAVDRRGRASASSRVGPPRGATCSAPTPTRSTSKSSLGAPSHKPTDSTRASRHARPTCTSAPSIRTPRRSKRATKAAGRCGGLSTPALHLVGDGAVVAYQRRGSATREVDGSRPAPVPACCCPEAGCRSMRRDSRLAICRS